MTTEAQEQTPFHVAVYEDPDMTPEQKLELMKMSLDHYWQLYEGAAKAVSIMRGGFSVIQSACKVDDPALFDSLIRNDIPVICGVALRASETVCGFQRNEQESRARKEAAGDDKQ